MPSCAAIHIVLSFGHPLFHSHRHRVPFFSIFFSETRSGWKWNSWVRVFEQCKWQECAARYKGTVTEPCACKKTRRERRGAAVLRIQLTPDGLPSLLLMQARDDETGHHVLFERVRTGIGPAEEKTFSPPTAEIRATCKE
jgi:hypothetical protein